MLSQQHQGVSPHSVDRQVKDASASLFYGILLVMLAFHLIIPITTMSYLGTTFTADSTSQMVQTDDWRRKLLIFNLWFWVVVSTLSFANGVRNAVMTPAFFLYRIKDLAHIVISSIGLSYLGLTFTHTEAQLDTRDWRCKMLVIYAYLMIIQLMASAGEALYIRFV